MYPHPKNEKQIDIQKISFGKMIAKRIGWTVKPHELEGEFLSLEEFCK